MVKLTRLSSTLTLLQATRASAAPSSSTSWWAQRMASDPKPKPKPKPKPNLNPNKVGAADGF